MIPNPEKVLIAKDKFDPRKYSIFMIVVGTKSGALQYFVNSFES